MIFLGTYSKQDLFLSSFPFRSHRKNSTKPQADELGVSFVASFDAPKLEHLLIGSKDAEICFLSLWFGASFLHKYFWFGALALKSTNSLFWTFLRSGKTRCRWPLRDTRGNCWLKTSSNYPPTRLFQGTSLGTFWMPVWRVLFLHPIGAFCKSCFIKAGGWFLNLFSSGESSESFSFRKCFYTFSAFWLWSSVVSVLISPISDTVLRHPDIWQNFSRVDLGAPLRQLGALFQRVLGPTRLPCGAQPNFWTKKRRLGSILHSKWLFDTYEIFFGREKKFGISLHAPKASKEVQKAFFGSFLERKNFALFPPKRLFREKEHQKLFAKKENTICVSWVRGFVRTAILRGKHRIPSDLRS